MLACLACFILSESTNVTGNGIQPKFYIKYNYYNKPYGFLTNYKKGTELVRNYVGCSVTLDNVKIGSCYSLGQSMQEGSGGALYIQYSDTYLTNVDLSGNQAIFGGAISALQSNFIYNNGIVEGNKALKVAGAIFAALDTADETEHGLYNIDLQISKIIFKSNTALISFGAVAFTYISDAFIQNCEFIQNNAQVSGGAFGAFCSQTYFYETQFYSNSVTETQIKSEKYEVGKRPLLTANSNSVCYGGAAVALRGPRTVKEMSNLVPRPNALFYSCSFFNNVVDPVFGNNTDIVAQGDIEVGFKGDTRTSKGSFQEFALSLTEDAEIGFDAISYNNSDDSYPVPATNPAPNPLEKVVSKPDVAYEKDTELENNTYAEAQKPSPSVPANILWGSNATLFTLSHDRIINPDVHAITISTYTIHATQSPTMSPMPTNSGNQDPGISEGTVEKDLGLIIGLSVGAFVIVLIAVVIGVWLFFRMKNAEQPINTEGANDQESESDNLDGDYTQAKTQPEESIDEEMADTAWL